MKPVVLLDSGTSFIEQQFQEPGAAPDIQRLDIYDLADADLSGYAGMIVPGSVDQEWAHKNTKVFADFLSQGKVVVYSGAIFRSWLPGTSPFIPKTIRNHRDYALRIVDHGGIFEGVDDKDVTTRKGVSGFFARGCNPIPPGVHVLVEFVSGEPVVYVDRSSSGGTVLVHSGNDLWSFGQEGTTTTRLRPQLLQWIANEYETLQNRRG